MRRFLEFVLSPTYFFADFRKRAIRDQGESAIGDLIRRYNIRYLAIAIMLSIGVGGTYQWNNYDIDYPKTYVAFVVFLIWLYPLSRANEIFYAFLRDAIHKVDGDQP